MESKIKMHWMNGLGAPIPLDTTLPGSIQDSSAKLEALTNFHPLFNLPWYALGAIITKWFFGYTTRVTLNVASFSKIKTGLKILVFTETICFTPPSESFRNSRAYTSSATNSSNTDRDFGAIKYQTLWSHQQHMMSMHDPHLQRDNTRTWVLSWYKTFTLWYPE